MLYQGNSHSCFKFPVAKMFTSSSLQSWPCLFAPYSTVGYIIVILICWFFFSQDDNADDKMLKKNVYVQVTAGGGIFKLWGLF